MISGFFSAINSFATTIGNFGEMKELKMTNDIKFSFFQPINRDILFVASTSNCIDQIMIEQTLKRISHDFIQNYPEVVKGNKWSGKTDHFSSFNSIINSILIDAESRRLIVQSNRNIRKKEITSVVIGRSQNKSISSRIMAENIRDTNRKHQIDRQIVFKQMKASNYLPYSKEVFYKLVPMKKVDNDESIYDIFSGEDSKKVFKKINGKISLESISNLTGIRNDRVFSLCKSFIKMGLISFTN